MIIGIDIDDTLLNTSESFEEIKSKYNLVFNKKLKDKWTIEETKFIYENYLEEFLMKAKLKEGAKEVIDYLYSNGYKIIIITARNNNICKNIEEKTLKQIKKEGLKISEFYFRQIDKSDLGKKLNLDLMIDDNINVYNNMKRENIDCILFGDKIKTWKDVLEYIQRKEI